MGRRVAASGVSFAFLASPLRAGDGGASPPDDVVALLLRLTLLALVFILYTTLVWRLRVRILRRFTDFAVESTRGIASRRLRSAGLRRAVQLTRIGVRLGSVGLILLGAFVWLTVSAHAVPFTRAAALSVEERLLEQLEFAVRSVAGLLPDLGVIALVYFVARIAYEMLGHYFHSISKGEIESTVFDAVTAETTWRLTQIGIWVVAVIIAFPYLPGSHTAAFRGVSVLAGLMLSLGSTSLVAQFTSGLTLIYGRILRPGDYVETERGEGVVERIGLFACTLRTARDEVLALPHTCVTAGLKNYSRGETGVRLSTELTIGYDAPWRQVRELLLAAAGSTIGVRAEPPPSVRQAGLEDFYVRYELQFTPENPAERQALLGRIHEAIQDRFHAAGVQIMSPHYLGDPAEPKIPRAQGGAISGGGARPAKP